MRRPKTSLLVTMSLAVTAVVFVAGSAAASTPKKPTTTTSKSSSKSTSKPKATSTTTTSTLTSTLSDPNANVPGGHYFVLNGTANAASDHVIAGSSAFPNFRTGAVDNYYSMSHAHVDNSPFAEGTASPADTGPVGQTAAAGNFQQPQYADARWPGDDKSGKATYGTQGQPYASAGASEFNATAEASEASSSLSSPNMPASMKLAAPTAFDGKLRAALTAWKAKWQDRLRPQRPVGSGTRTITIPSATVPTPVGTVTRPAVTVPGVNAPPTPSPPVAVPVTVPVSVPPVPRSAAHENTAQSRSLAAAPAAPAASGSSSSSADGASLLESSTQSVLDPKTDVLITTGESRLGRVTLGGGQIVIHGIHVIATITNNGKGPSYKVAISVASATIGGVPVTIDQDGVHIAGQVQGVPYQQASDALNSALKQAGIQLFLVSPEVTRNSCDPMGGGGGNYSSGSGGNSNSNSNSNSNANDPTMSSSSNSCDSSGMGMTGSSSCDQSYSGNGNGNGSTTTTTSQSPLTPSTTTTTTSSCDQPSSCQSGSSTGTNSSTTTTTASPLTPTTTTTTTTSKTKTTSSRETGTTTTASTSSCEGMTTPSSGCTQANPSGTTTNSNYQSSTTSTTSTTSTSTTTTTPFSSDQTDTAAGTANATGEMTVIATGLHVVFTQPDGAPSGVPAQNAEHILGEVYLDSLAVPAVPLSSYDLGLSGSSSSSSSSSSSCLGGVAGGSKTGGGLLAGGSTSGSNSGFASGSSSGFGSNASGSPIANVASNIASILRKKPLWVLLAFLVWQALAVGTGASLWHWRRGGTA